MIKVGDIVECICDDNIPLRHKLIKKGLTYIVSSISEFDNGLGVMLEEVKKECTVVDNYGNKLFITKIPYNVNRFRKIDISIKELLKEDELCH